MRKLFVSMAAFFVMACLAKADVSGKWSGSAELKTPEGESQVLPVSAEFKQQDKLVNGTIGKEGEEQYPIEKGAIESSKLSFEFTAPEEDEASGKRIYTVRLNVVSEAQLEGEFEFTTNGAKVTGKLTLARAK
jgi:hypothetical protein